MKPNIGLSNYSTEETCKLLNTLLADEISIYSRTRNCHWNVVGPAFSVLHKFFEEQYEQIEGISDSVAERVRMLGGTAEGGLATVVANSRLEEEKHESGAMKMVLGLLSDHEAIIRAVRENITEVDETHKDAGTADFLTGVLEAHEKMAWMLRAHL